MKTGRKFHKCKLIQLLYLMSAFILPGCEKVIEINLNEASPQIVIEGLITDKRGPYVVNISKTGSFFNQPSIEAVSKAIAVITDDFGNIDTLRETTSGTYVTSRMRGIYERIYSLKVISEGQEYTGSTKLSQRVNIDSLKLRKSELQGFFFGGDENQLEIHCYFRDPSEKNYYRIRVFKNDSINTVSYRMYDDQYANGQITEAVVSFANPGDTYRVELLSIDKPTYIYYRSLGDLLNTSPVFGSTPANPESNLSNGALGYFGSYAVASKTIVITEELINAVK